jgi:hypothetical protein
MVMGIGAVGCMVASPPAFISEDEAIELIISECQNTVLISKQKIVLIFLLKLILSVEVGYDVGKKVEDYC